MRSTKHGINIIWFIKVSFTPKKCYFCPDAQLGLNSYVFQIQKRMAGAQIKPQSQRSQKRAKVPEAVFHTCTSALHVSVTTDHHWIYWTNFLTLEQKFSGRWLVFFDSFFCGYHHTATPLITFLTQPNSPQINQRHHTHIIPFNWLPSHTSKFALYKFV